MRSGTLLDKRCGAKEEPIVDGDEKATHVLAQLPAGPVLSLLCRIRIVLLLPFSVHFLISICFRKKKKTLFNRKITFLSNLFLM